MSAGPLDAGFSATRGPREIEDFVGWVAPGRRGHEDARSSGAKSVKGVRDREFSAELEGALVDGVEGRGVVDPLHEVCDAVANHNHLRLAHASRGDEWSADPDAARVELRGVVERDRVAVERDLTFAQC